MADFNAEMKNILAINAIYGIIKIYVALLVALESNRRPKNIGICFFNNT